MRRQTLRVTVGIALLALGLAAAMFGGTADGAATRQLHPGIHGKWGIYRDGSGVYVFAMRVTGMPPRTRVTIRCSHLCSARESRTVGRSGWIASRKFKRLKLRPGAVVAIRATKAGFDGALVRLGILANPKTRAVFRESRFCLPAGSSKPKLKCSPRGFPGGTTTVTLAGNGAVLPSPTPLPPTTTESAPAPILAPTGLQANVGLTNDVAVSWNRVAIATGYLVFLDGAQVAILGAVTTYSSSPLACGKTYTIGVQATSSTAKSPLATTTVSTAACPGGPEQTTLPQPSGVSASVTADSHLVLSWNAVSAATAYNIYLSGARVDQTSATSYDYGAVACGKSFSPGVQSLGSPGNISTVATVTVSSPQCSGGSPDTTPPSPPANLTEDFPSETGFTVDWSPATDDVGVTGYDIYLSGTKVATVAAGSTVPSVGLPGYVFSGLSCGTTYQVAVSAFDAAGNRSTQATVNAVTTACPASVAPPTSVVGTIDSSGKASLSWEAVPGADGYYVWLNGSRMLEVSGTSFFYGMIGCGQTWTLGVQTVAGGEVSVVVTVKVTANPC
ncbi:MAG TPA: fibronectin type III domain-containing protein [Gaiellaceae bacterium]|nr:fibronectin type III domain-containing protein [Gaiellaceae bacterium]